MKRILRIGRGVKVRRAKVEEICNLPLETMDVDMKTELIQALIPIGLWFVREVLEQEVKGLAGERYKRQGLSGYDRWGKQGGSVYLLDQKLPIMVPSVRDRREGREVHLRSYERVCQEMLERGLNIEPGFLCVVDGSKGLRKAIYGVFGNKVLLQRCQWQKRENVVRYLLKSMQARMRQRLQEAYQEPTYEKVKERLLKIRRELQLINQSAVSSLDEGMEETLTLHRLELFRELGTSFKTTNCIESIMALVG